MRKQLGMTLIEMIIAIVLMGIAMVAFTSFLVPQIRDSAMPHYQTRATALGQSFMSQILARGFDENSDFDGGLFRCGENSTSCTLPANLGPDSGESIPEDFDDVDDYIGCWSTPTTVAQCQETSRGNISDILGASSEDKYRNFRVEVSVAYDDLSATPPTGITNYKKVTVRIFASNAQPLTLTAIRGNY
ncbi:COG2165 Type II secretory pathway [Vibrio sp. B1FIG11]|uniref:type IV pilus modification PilV family protein n=1 Tax=Vibrio sp. B1FIG11 TaxID=2751177 RepID=UPI001AFB2712|nr:type II secretion system protein [Vibrio sp. B1FIG11]CAD7815321.1 COG2165 Type II secretory pathway [Vibrio sp. B1FIG11]CAE6924808.1 COG2165 Type II secretory pathway [Vibrio sp. B1FIG11]